jgi:hypothetical protein
MKALIALFLSLFALAAQAQGSAPATVDLNRPGALDALRASDPERYDQVSRILQVAERTSCRYVGPALFKAAGLDVQQAECGVLLLTSLPAKRHVTFTIDDTHYVAIVSMQDSVGFLLPAK